MTKFQYLDRVKCVKILQLELEGSQFKPNLALGWAFYNCCLADLQPILDPPQRHSLTNPMFIKVFSTILTWSSPGAL